jgi:hypothetical protein
MAMKNTTGGSRKPAPKMAAKPKPKPKATVTKSRGSKTAVQMGNMNQMERNRIHRGYETKSSAAKVEKGTRHDKAVRINQRAGGGKNPSYYELKAGKSAKGSNAQQLNKAIKLVQKRAGVTAREARDLVTEVGTIVNHRRQIMVASEVDRINMRNSQLRRRLPAESAGAKSLVKQIKEVGTAAKTGKKGTTPALQSGNSTNPLSKHKKDRKFELYARNRGGAELSVGNKQRSNAPKKGSTGPGAKMVKSAKPKAMPAAPAGRRTAKKVPATKRPGTRGR